MISESIKKGFSFGIASAVITTLGLMVGLHSGTHSTLVVVGGILMIAIADSMSDALGVHMSEESENHHTVREIWEATLSAFLTKFIFTLTFIIPIWLFTLNIAIIVNIVWGMFLLIAFSIYMAIQQKGRIHTTVCEHVSIAVVVIILSYYTGNMLDKYFN